MPFAMIAGRTAEIRGVQFNENSFTFLAATGEELKPDFVQALSSAEKINIQDPGVWISTQAVLKLLQMELYLRKFGISWEKFLLTGSSIMWFFHRCPFKDLDFVVSSEVSQYMRPGPFPVDRRPKLDFFKNYSLEVLVEQQKPQIVPIGFFGQSIPAIHPIDGLFGSMCTSTPEVFNQRGLARIEYVLSFHGRPGHELFLSKCKKAINDWVFPPNNTRVLKLNAKKAYQFVSQLKVPAKPMLRKADNFDIWDFLV